MTCCTAHANVCVSVSRSSGPGRYGSCSTWLIVFIFTVTAGDAAALGVAAWAVRLTAHDLLLFGALLACIAATVEFTKRAGHSAGVVKDVYAVWELPVAILLPPLCALLAPLLQYVLTHWRGRSCHRTGARSASPRSGSPTASPRVAFHTVAQPALGPVAGAGCPHMSLWLLAVAAIGLLRWTVNQGLAPPAHQGCGSGHADPRPAAGPGAGAERRR